MKKISNVFYLLFISTILAPIIFIIISNKSCVLYHFVNLIILNWIDLYFNYHVDLYKKDKI